MNRRRLFWLILLVPLLLNSFGLGGNSAQNIPVTSYHQSGGVLPSDLSRPTGLVTVEAPNLFSLVVKQQPADQPGYVASEPGIVTQFAIAAHAGTIGLLAHNTLAGSAFFGLQPHQRVSILLSSGIRRYYRIGSIEKYQALQPTNPYSNFLDLTNPEVLLSSTEVFQRIYEQVGKLVFQTCIERDGNPSWGRMFITAFPEEELADLAILRPWKNYYTF